MKCKGIVELAGPTEGLDDLFEFDIDEGHMARSWLYQVRGVETGGLLDEMIVQVGSVTLGKGQPLFPRRLTNPPLTLLSVRQVGTGFAELRYQVPKASAQDAD